MSNPEEDVRSPDEGELTEERMRRALGLGRVTLQPTLTSKGDASSSPTTGPRSSRLLSKEPARGAGAANHASVTSPLQQRAMELEQQLASERQRHDDVRALLQKAVITGRTLEMQLQQATLAQREELDVERGAVIKAQRALDDALFEIQQRDNARRSAMTDR